ncbi:B3GN3 acetylglucosaminyltransferase, partial [Polyodon spathula]|nr:N-acetyllactosaminide beta-1,3-N-acetylglucosaminyltransferase 3-like [Polyodon spathula]MBN3280057.1 B3GN3 acetylglucosaminyltransferase [Polyodon spathula]
MRITFRKAGTAVLLLVALLCLVFMFFNGTDTHKLLREVGRSSPGAERPFESQHPSLVGQLMPVCKENASAANISGFSALPQHIQDFLRYRHCRKFPLMLDIPEKCGKTAQDSADIFLLLVIKSSPPNYDRREVIRKTWGVERRENGVWIRRIFISGNTENPKDARRMNRLLELEHREHRDILQWDFKDTFYNLTLKQLLFLEWMEVRCPHVCFLLNGDDDIFANTDNVVEYLQSQEGNNGSKHLFVGHLIQWVGPIRDAGSKYYIPVQVEESNSYPPYCGGGGFLLSGFTARTIYKMSFNITLLPIDDVYMGMCLKQAGLEPASHMGVRTAGLHVPSKQIDPYNPCFYREILLVHRFLPYEILITWHDIHDPQLNCNIGL